MGTSINRRLVLFLMATFILATTMVVLGFASADDLRASAQHLSDSAFAILNSISGDSSKTDGADAMGAIASFAGDAQTLSAALAKNDREGAASAMTALISDRRAVDEALAKNPHAIEISKWAPLKAELASIQPRVPTASSVGKRGEGPPPGEVVKPPASEMTTIGPDAQPHVEITSRESDDTGLHLKGYLQGTDLKSAGIYAGDAMIQKIDLAPTTGAQRVLLDFKLEQVSPDETIRVADASGRTAEAHVASNTTVAVESGGHEKMIELGGGGTVNDGPPPVELASRGPNNTAEIPSKSPSRRHMHAHETLAPLTDVQINILGVQQNLSNSAAYGITGQISGEAVKRAGIYVDGRLVKPIPITPGADTAFNVNFTMLGSEATIRAYGNGSNFVESSIDLSSANGAIFGSNPAAGAYGYPVNPYAPYARAPYGYPPNPYGAANPYGPPPYGYPKNGYPNGYPPPKRPWWQRIF